MNSKIMWTAMLLIFCFSASAQERKPQRTIEKTASGVEQAPKVAARMDTKKDENEIYRQVEVMPQPAYDKNEFFAKRLSYPVEAREKKIQGRVVVEFVVEKDGSITDAKVIKGAELGHGIPEEAIRAVKAMPKWKPAMMNGAPVRAYHMLPLTFTLDQ